MSNFRYLPNNSEEVAKQKEGDGKVSEYHQSLLRATWEIAYQLKRVADNLTKE